MLRWIRASFAIDAPLRRYFFRDLATYGALAAALVLVLGVAWISRNTDSPVVGAAERWPIVGGWAKSLRDRYRPSQSASEAAPLEPEDDLGVFQSGAPFVADVEAFRASIGEDPPLGSDPVPPRPLPGRRADPARLDTALGAFSRGYEKTTLGPYVLFSDVEDGVLLERLDRLASGLEESYEHRYGLSPIGEAAATYFGRHCQSKLA